ncbi:uncharacterized protein LOC121601068 [Anopheles merus]|uniref:uncharacterized protein LOC121601068 n=1 Tax=Anopheles merus TaxID=30066 RepID=UPI001BE464D5|nr:uncharacterized protein LOC121601068 [Anopheles merus]
MLHSLKSKISFIISLVFSAKHKKDTFSEMASNNVYKTITAPMATVPDLSVKAQASVVPATIVPLKISVSTSPLFLPENVQQTNNPVIIKTEQMCRPALTVNAPVKLVQWSKASASCVLSASPLSALGTVNQNNKPVVIQSGQMGRRVLTVNAPVNLVQSSAIASSPRVHSASPSSAPESAKQCKQTPST